MQKIVILTIDKDGTIKGLEELNELLEKKGWEVVDIHNMEGKGEEGVIRYSTIVVLRK